MQAEFIVVLLLKSYINSTAQAQLKRNTNRCFSATLGSIKKIIGADARFFDILLVRKRGINSRDQLFSYRIF